MSEADHDLGVDLVLPDEEAICVPNDATFFQAVRSVLPKCATGERTLTRTSIKP